MAPTTRLPAPPKGRRRWTSFIPPQHGAWAFLIVPLIAGFICAGMTWIGLLFAVAWIVAYPVGYFGGRALTVRLRRGSWTALARRESSRAIPWAIALGVVAVPLLIARPWLLLAAVAVALAWWLSLAITLRGSARGLANDGLLVLLAMVAVPLVWAVTANPNREVSVGDLIVVTAATGVFLFGSVLHVKALLRKAKSVGFRRLSLGYHVIALVAFTLISPWWIVGFGPALARDALMRPGLRPGTIGAVESIVSVCFVCAIALSV